MKVKDYKGKDLNKKKIKLTQELKEQYANYCSKGEDEIYLCGSLMGDWFISPDAPDVKKRILYPMPISVDPKDFLECEII